MLQALDLTFEPEVTPSVRGGSASATLAAELKRQYERLLAHDPGTRLGTHDEELHQFRVATRRLRAFLRAGQELLDPAWGESLRTELRWLGGELGPSRDLDVLIANLREEVEPSATMQRAAARSSSCSSATGRASATTCVTRSRASATSRSSTASSRRRLSSTRE